MYQLNTKFSDMNGAELSLSQSITEFKEERIIVEDEIRTLVLMDRKMKDEPNRLDVYRLLPELIGKSFEQTLAPQIQGLFDLLEKKEDLMYRVTEENPDVKTINKKVNVKISTVIRAIASNLDRQNTKLKMLNAKINEFEAEFYGLPIKKQEYNRLKGIQDLNEKYFNMLTEKKAMYALSDAGYSSSNRILTRPTVNTSPISPNGKLIYGTLAMFGFILGIAVMFFKYLSFNEINMLDDLKSILPEKATILGGVPLSKQ